MRQLAPDLLLHPILDEAEALTGVPNREVVHPSIEDIQRLVGNDQLVAITAKAHDWEDKIKVWTITRDLIAQRAPTWSLVERLAKHASGLAEAKPHLDQIERGLWSKSCSRRVDRGRENERRQSHKRTAAS
jgi:hypothetical protein